MIIPAHLIGVFVGCMLGDAHMANRPGRVTRFTMKQSIINFPFLWSTYIMLSSYCSAYPRLIKDKRSYSVEIVTRAHPVLSFVYNLFHFGGTKGIHNDLIHYLSPQALAYWIMCDGAHLAGGVVLCTDSFTLPDTVKLINMLIIRYQLDPYLAKSGSGPRIVIRAKDLDKLRAIVTPHMCQFSMYKLAGVSRANYIK